MRNRCSICRIDAILMELTAEQLDKFIDDQRGRVARFVAPVNLERAVAEIRERIRDRLPQVPDRRSLENLIEVTAVDFELRPSVAELTKGTPDNALMEELFAWGGRYLEQQVLKSIRLYAGKDPVQVDTILTDVKSLMWEKRGQFDPRKGSFIPWVRGIASNHARSRPGPHQREVSLDADPQRPLDLPSPGPTPEESVADGAMVQGPPVDSFTEILKLVQESEPHMAIAFLLIRYLDQKPAQIALDIQDVPLPEALAKIKQIVWNQYPEIAGFETLLGPLSARVEGVARTLGDYCRKGKRLPDEISRWVGEVQRSVSSTILQLGKRFLRCVCELSAAGHEIVCFLWVRLLRAAPVTLRDQAHKELLRLIELFHEAYSRRELLSREQIEWATAPLRKRIRPESPKRIRPERTLQEFVGKDFYSDLNRWCEHVALLIQSAPCAGGMLGYAYIAGSVRKGSPV